MKRSSRPRTTAKLSESLHQRLNLYAIAAGAAAVSVLASARPAVAKIVYTPAHVRIGAFDLAYTLDLNHDGHGDFILLNRTSCNSSFCNTYLSIKAAADNAVNGFQILRNPHRSACWLSERKASRGGGGNCRYSKATDCLLAATHFSS